MLIKYSRLWEGVLTTFMTFLDLLKIVRLNLALPNLTYQT